MNLRFLIVVALIVVGSAATATLAQKLGTEKTPAAPSEFVKVGNSYLRHSEISMFRYDDGDSITLFLSGQPYILDPKDCTELLRVLRLPPPDPAKPGP
jgi:hypothetical protein